MAQDRGEQKTSGFDFNKAAQLYKEKKYAEALIYLDDVIKSNPSSAKAYLVRADVIAASKKIEDACKAIADYNLYLILNPDAKKNLKKMSSILYAKAHLYEDLGFYDIAIRIYNEALAILSKDIPSKDSAVIEKTKNKCRQHLARCYKHDQEEYLIHILNSIARGDKEDAEYSKFLSKWMSVQKTHDLIITFIMKEIQSREVQIVLLEKCLQKTVPLGREFYHDCRHLKKPEWEKQKDEIRKLIEALKKDPTSTLPPPTNYLDFYQQAEHHQKAREYKKAIEFCDKVVELKPEFTEAYFLRGQCYASQ